MNRPYDEQISALADDELSQAETGLLLRRAQVDCAFGKRIGRYALIRDAMHRNLPEIINEGLAERVAAALALEPTYEASQRSLPVNHHRHWIRPASGFAIAASVAMLAIVIWPSQQDVQDSASQISATQTASVESGTSQGSVQTVASENIRWERLDPDVQARLNGYAITHGEQSTGQMGITPRHVRITGQELEQ